MSLENEYFYDLVKICVYSFKICFFVFIIYFVRFDIFSVIYVLFGLLFGEYVICIKLYFNIKYSKKSFFLFVY